MVVPETWETLNDFADWYVEKNYPIRVPANVSVYPTDVSYSCCVFRQDVYQVEMYLAKPNFKSSRHAHPFEQVIIFLGGHMSGVRGVNDTQIGDEVFLGNPLTDDTSVTMPHPQSFARGSVLPAGQWHEVSGYGQGFVFFNLQKWKSKEIMTSAVVEYEGDALGDIHTHIIKR